MQEQLPGTQPSTYPIIVQVVGYKNSGKTTLICKLIAALNVAGYKVGTIKHDAHEFEMDRVGTDTWRHQDAGATITAISSSTHTAILKKKPDTLDELIHHLSGHVHMILVEGFKSASYPKLLLIRKHTDLTLIHELQQVCSIVRWPEMLDACSELSIPHYAIDDVPSIVEHIMLLPSH